MMSRKAYTKMALLSATALLTLVGCGGGKTASDPKRGEAMAVSSEVAKAESIPELSEGQPVGLTGEYWQATLGPGRYRVGTDIPLGVMNLFVLSGSGHVSSSDGTLNLDMIEGNGAESITEGALLAQEIMAAEEHASNDMPDLESVDTLTDEEMQEILAAAEMGEEEPVSYYYGVGFDKDVVIEVSGTLRVRFESDNCDLTGMKKRSVVGDVYTFSEGAYKAGEDFDPGTYTITVMEGIGSMRTGDGSVFVYLGYPSEPGINSESYMNLELGEGKTIELQGVTVNMQRVSE